MPNLLKEFHFLHIAHLAVAMKGDPSGVFEWDDALGQFINIWEGDPLVDLYPVTINQRPGAYTILAEARPLDLSNQPLQSIFLESYITAGHSDYIFR